MQRALDGWEWLLTETLHREAQLPWIVLFDDSCVWHLGGIDGLVAGAQPLPAGLTFAGRDVPVAATRHGGTILLPNGREVPPAPMASGFLYRRQGAVIPFFALAMIDLWRGEAKTADQPRLDRFFLGVAIHELVHTLQLVDLDRHVAELRARHQLPASFDDDVVQNRFGDVAGFRAAFEAERDLLYRAAAASDPWAQRVLATQGLSLLRERRRHFFHGDEAFYSRLEDLFLNLEGLAVWSHFQLALEHEGVAFLPDRYSADPADLIEHARGQGYWSQEEGFALLLLLDRLAPEWRARVMGSELASPVDVLEEAL